MIILMAIAAVLNTVLLFMHYFANNLRGMVLDGVLVMFSVIFLAAENIKEEIRKGQSMGGQK